MIEINLLPPSLRQARRRAELPPTAFIILGGGILSLFLIISIGLTASTHVRSRRLREVQEEFNRLKPQSEKVAQLKEKKAKLERKMAVIEQLVDKRILWARKLNELSNLIPPQIWLTALFIEERAMPAESDTKGPVKKKFLVIKGVAIAERGGRAGELRLVGDFMESIREDNSFYADFVNVEQHGPIRRSKVGNSETMHFELNCEFKEGR